MADRKVKLQEVADSLKISKGSVFTILHEHLSMRKLLTKWVPLVLTVDQKQQRVNDSERCLELFQYYKKDFLTRYVTMDETWIHYYRTPAAGDSPADGPPSKRPKTHQCAGKVRASVFWDARGIIFIDYVENDKTGPSYSSLLDRLKSEIAEKRPHLMMEKIFYHHDNTPAHSSLDAQAKLSAVGFELVPQPPDSPDLAPSNFYLFPNLKKWLTGQRFYSTEELIAETNAYFEKLPIDHSDGIKTLKNRWTRCVDLKGEYVEK